MRGTGNRVNRGGVSYGLKKCLRDWVLSLGIHRVFELLSMIVDL